MCICGIYAYVYIHIYVCIYVCVCIYIYMCGNTAYRAIEPLRITAREIPSPRQPYLQAGPSPPSDVHDHRVTPRDGYIL